jgi:hypothetical protein
MKAQSQMDGAMKVALVLALLLVVAAGILMVLPGYYLFLAGDLPFGRFLGRFHGDNWLPVAMQMQLFWAPVLPASLWMARRLPWAATRPRSWLVAAVLCAVWAVCLATLLHWQALDA